MTETRTLKNFVGGEYVDASNGRTYDLVNPATGQTFAQAPISEQEDIDRAFEAAAEGLRDVARYDALRRGSSRS